MCGGMWAPPTIYLYIALRKSSAGYSTSLVCVCVCVWHSQARNDTHPQPDTHGHVPTSFACLRVGNAMHARTRCL